MWESKVCWQFLLLFILLQCRVCSISDCLQTKILTFITNMWNCKWELKPKARFCIKITIIGLFSWKKSIWLQSTWPRTYWINCMAYFMTFYGVFCHFWALKTVVIHFHCMEKGIPCFQPCVKKKNDKKKNGRFKWHGWVFNDRLFTSR